MADDADGSAATGAASGTDGLLGRLSDLAWRALPAIGSAIGFVGFVAVIGGAIEWIRFKAANLPATQAVLAVPKQELVVVGALALALFVLAAVFAVLLVYLIEREGNATYNAVRAIVALGVFELVVALFLLDSPSPLEAIALIVWFSALGGVGAEATGAATVNLRASVRLKRARDELVARLDALAIATIRDTGENHNGEVEFLTAYRGWERAIGEWDRWADELTPGLPVQASKRLSSARSKLKKFRTSPPLGYVLEEVLDNGEKDVRHVFRAVWAHLTSWEDVNGFLESFLVGLLLLIMSAATPVAGAILAGKNVSLFLVIVLLVVVLLTATNVFVARATDKFAWYGISVFFSVLLFGAALTIARTLHEPKVQPVALVRKDNEIGTCGVYVTQTSDRVYVGRLPALGKRPGEIFWVRASDVDLVSVGQPEMIGNRKSKKRFSNYAESMLERLYKDRAEEAAPALKNKTIAEEGKKPASKEQAKRIHGLHVVTHTETSEAPPEKVRSKPHPHVRISRTTCTAPQRVEVKQAPQLSAVASAARRRAG